CPAETVDSTKLDCQPSGLPTPTARCEGNSWSESRLLLFALVCVQLPQPHSHGHDATCTLKKADDQSCVRDSLVFEEAAFQLQRRMLRQRLHPERRPTRHRLEEPWLGHRLIFRSDSQIEKTGFKVTLSQYLPVHCISGEQNLEATTDSIVSIDRPNADRREEWEYRKRIDEFTLEDDKPVTIDLSQVAPNYVTEIDSAFYNHSTYIFKFERPPTPEKSTLRCLSSTQPRATNRRSVQLTVPLYIKSAEWKSDVYFNFTRFGLYTDPPDPSCRMSGFNHHPDGRRRGYGSEQVDGNVDLLFEDLRGQEQVVPDGVVLSFNINRNKCDHNYEEPLPYGSSTRCEVANESESLSHYYEFSLDVFTLDVCLNSKLLMSESINGSFSKETTLCGYKKGEKFSTISSRQDCLLMFLFEPCSEPGWISFNNSCYAYKRPSAPVSWDEASMECSRLGGHLVSIQSQDEMNAIKQMLLYEWHSEAFAHR
uniref:C-type lectin domain-containing protein n=1 Tax=Macrostomum lignano TaxID=282301 RepID=A0A1I8FES1_9PLAT